MQLHDAWPFATCHIEINVGTSQLNSGHSPPSHEYPDKIGLDYGTMRLTNVTQMALPQGGVHSYVPTVRQASGQLPISFDQERHVSEGDRAGSWMAIAFRLPEEVSSADLAEAWLRTIGRHSSLQSLFTGSAGDLKLFPIEVTGGSWQSHPTASGDRTQDTLSEVLDRACSPFSHPAHRLCLVEAGAGEPDRRPTVVIGSDHAHVDMWSLLVVVHDLLAGLRAEARPPVAGFAEHTAALKNMPPAPPEVQGGWTRALDLGDGFMPTFPLPLGDISQPRPAVVEVRDVLDRPALDRLEQQAKNTGVRLTSLAVSALTEVMAEQAQAPLRAVFPVHSRHEPRWHDAVGWFITNSIIESTDPAPAACAQAIKQALILGSYPLAPIMAPYGGMPTPPGMFALSWLDMRRLPVQLEPNLEIQYVSAVVPTNGVMLWFLVNDYGLHLRCRYPDTPQARFSVEAWLIAVERALVDISNLCPADPAPMTDL